MPTFITPVDVTHAVDTTWTDVDVTAHVGADAGNVAGVMLYIKSTSSSEWGVRKNGSSVDVRNDLFGTTGTWCAIGVDSNDIFELYLEDASDFECWLLGYITEDEGTFLDDLTEVTHSTDAAWTDIDISSHTGDDTATVAFLIMNHKSSVNDTGLRKNGSSETLLWYAWSDLLGAWVELDESEIFEMYLEDASDDDIYLAGWLTSGYTGISRTDVSPTADGTWRDVDVSANVPAGNTGAWLWFHDGTAVSELSGSDGGARPNGSSDDLRGICLGAAFGFAQLDGSRIFEGYLEASGHNIYLLGYSEEYSAPGGSGGGRLVGGKLVGGGNLIGGTLV